MNGDNSSGLHISKLAKQVEFKFTFWLKDRNEIKVGSVRFAALVITEPLKELKCDDLDIYT
jgi:hypothetical protein